MGGLMDWKTWESAEKVTFNLHESGERINAQNLGTEHTGLRVAVWKGDTFVCGEISEIRFRNDEFVRVTLGEGDTAIKVRLDPFDTVRFLQYSNAFEATPSPAADVDVVS